MRRSRLLLVLIVAGLAGHLSYPRAQVASSVIYGTGGTTFHGIGDLPAGGVNSIVQEATQVGSTIYAVGASTRTATNAPIPNPDTAVVWDSVSNALTVIPDLVAFADPQPTSVNSVAYAITPDAQFVASRARSVAANFNLSNGIKVPRTSLTTTRSIAAFTALDISDNGNILFGQQSGGTATVNNSRAIRFDVSGPANTSVDVPLLTPASITPGGPCSSSAPICLDNLPAYRGMSWDGSVLVGTAFTGGFTGSQNQYQTTNGLAFRWKFNEPTVTEIPRPTGGTWSSAIAISRDGDLTLAGGNSSDYPLGEVWIHHANDDTPGDDDTIEELGSPNTALFPKLYGGMTADGSVVGATFGGGSLSQNPGFSANPIQYAYLHNSHGWFQLANVLADQGVDLWANGWNPTDVFLTGIRTVDTDGNGTWDVDLVFGQGRRRNLNGSPGATEGFVASFQIGVLAGYQLPAAAPVANHALVGAWALGPNPNNPPSVIVFTADGTYYSITPRGAAGYANADTKFERGVYTLTPGNALTLNTTEDRDGSGPPLNSSPPFVYPNGNTSGLNGRLSLSANFTSADTFVIEDATCSPVCNIIQATRIAGGAGEIVGGWTANDLPFLDDGTLVIVFLNSSSSFKFFEAGDGESDNESQSGTYTWDPTTHALVTTEEGGGSPDTGTTTATLTRDELGLHVVITELDGDVFPLDLTRIVNPTTVLPSITNATLEASGAEDSAFSYTVTALNALTFGATGLPAGLTINPATGVISGTPAVNGIFNVTIIVTNTLGDTDTATLVLTFNAPPARIYGIGDLPPLPGGTGAVASAVRDATRVDGVIHAVGASAVNTTNGNQLDTPVLWSWTGVPSGTSGTLQGLPHSPLPGSPDFVSTQTDQLAAYAITPDAAYIASQAKRSNTPGAPWVRVTRSLLPSTTANFDINVAVGPSTSFAALAISDNGNTLYGQEVQANSTRLATRYEFGVGLSRLPLPVGMPADTTWTVPIPRGTSSDGLIMIGAASSGTYTGSNSPAGRFGYPVHATNTTAFRYVHNAGTLTGTSTALPKLSAAANAWSFPIAMSSNGAVTVVAGNSDAYPYGEIYLTNAANVVTASLGSPNTGMTPRIMGGRSDDGAIVVTFANDSTTMTGQIGGLGIPAASRLPYVHNGNGWFLLGSVLRAQGLDLEALDWAPTDMAVTGVRTVEGMDIIFGQARRRTFDPATGALTTTTQEGFVIELPAGVLAAFNAPTSLPTDESLVGAWAVTVPPATIPDTVPVYLADGRYVTFTQGPGVYQNGLERGRYFWAGNGGEWYPTTRFDTNGSSFGQHGFSAVLGRTLTVTGDTYRIANAHCNPSSTTPACVGLDRQRVAGSSDSIVGAWSGTIPDGPFAGTVVTAAFLSAAQGLRYLIDYDLPGSDDELELGTYTYNAGTHTVTVVKDGGGGGFDPADATLSRDGLGLVITDDGVTIPLTRVVAHSTVVPIITSAFSATGTIGTPFTYTITASHGLTFGATSLPAGLTVDGDTGVISGMPTVGGHIVATISATNSFGDTGTALLDLMIDNTLPGDDVTVTPPGSPVTLTFDSIAEPGVTEITAANPATAPALPAGFTAGTPPLYFLATSTATYNGPITACVATTGTNFQGGAPQLFSHDGTNWVATGSVVNSNGQVCGATPMLGYLVVMGDTRFRSIGDLPGGAVGSAVRDATKVGGTIYAVGSAVARNQNICTSPGVPAGCLTFPNLDSPAVWSSSTGLTSLPPGPNVTNPGGQATNTIFAYAMTPSANLIATQAHNNTTGSNGTTAYRASWNVATGALTNLDIFGSPPAIVAQAISDDGRILYVQRLVSAGVVVTSRYDCLNCPAISPGPTNVTQLPLPNYPDGTPTTQSVPTPRGTSSDGNVVVGVASNGVVTPTNGVAFRYVYGTGPGTTTRIERLDGGTWNFPVAVTPDGRYTVVAGNSTTYFINGEIYLYDAITGTSTPLGTPNRFMAPKMLGGITADGQALAVTFTETPSGFLALPVGGRHAYVHNAHGWFQLTSILTAQGIDLVAAGWDPANMLVAGIRSLDTDGNGIVDTELIFGQGRRRTLNATATGYDLGAQEGFVAELPAGTLAAFDVPVSDPATVDPSIVGAWAIGSPTAPDGVFVYFANGTYYSITGTGYERGRFRWGGNGTPVIRTPLYDTNGSGGFSGTTGNTFNVTITGDTYEATDIHCSGCPLVPVSRITGGSAPGSLVGAWRFGDPAGENSIALVLLGSAAGNSYFFAQDGEGNDDKGETGTYTDIGGVLSFTAIPPTGGGLNNDSADWTLAADDLALTVIPHPPGPPTPLTFLRVVHPAAVVPIVTSAAAASGEVSAPFSYLITASHGLTFAATGLAPGLSVNTTTGEIFGSPTSTGTFNATMLATNSFGDTGSAALELTIVTAVTPVAQNGAVTTGEDTPVAGTLVASDPNGAPLTYSLVSSGVLGTAVITNAATGTFTYTPHPNAYGTDWVGFKANDGALDSNVATVTVTITPVNDLPVAADGGLVTNEDTAAGGTLNVTDPDAQTLTVSIVTNGSLGVATVTNPATGAFTYTPSPNASGTDTFTFTANDGTADSNVATVTVTIATVDDAPVAASATLTTNEDTPVSGTLGATDAESPLTFSLVSTGTLGTAVLTNATTGAFTYTPDPNANGTDSFTFKANDGALDSSLATITVTITPVNDLPVAANGSLATTEDTPASGTLGATDADGPSLTFSIVTNGSRGTATVTSAAAGTFIYTPNPNASGTDAITFKVHDGTADSNVATVTVTIAAVEDAPVAASAALTTSEDSPVSGTLGASDAESPTLTFSLVSTGTLGTAVLTNPATGAFTYTPHANAAGTETFTFKASDGALDSNVATITVTIAPVDDQPVVVAGTLVTDEDAPASGTLAATDSDSSTLAFSIVTNGTLGTATITNAAAGTFTYTPNLDVSGTDTFTFKANDGTADSNVATVTVTIAAVNDAPTAAASGSLTTTEDTPAVGTLSATDPDNPALTFSIVANGLLGTAITHPTTGAFTYTPEANASGTDTFTFKASDGTLDSNVATVMVTITPANDAPIAANGSLTTNEDTLANGSLSAADVDSPALTFSIVANGTRGTATVTSPATGAFTYIPSPNANGTDTFTFKANDGTADSNVATVTVTIVAVNDAPVAVSGSLTTSEDTPAAGALSATDPENQTLAFTIVTNGSRGTATITNPATGAFLYTPNPNAFGADSFSFTAGDGTLDSNVATIAVTIAAVNDAPIAANGTLTTNEDTQAAGVLSATDPDSPTLTFSIVANGARGAATLTNLATGAFTYTPNPNANGADSFTFRTSDGSLFGNVATVTVTIAPVNDSPVATAVVLTTTGDATIGTLAGTDVDGDALTFSVTTLPSQGTLALTDPATGGLTYTANVGASGYDPFTFQVSDGHGGVSQATGMVFIVAPTPRWPGQTTRASVTSAGTEGVGGSSYNPSISADGRFVAFASQSKLVPEDTNGTSDIFVRDRQTSQTTRVSVHSNGTQGNGHSEAPAISADGRFVAFYSSAPNLVSGDNNGKSDVFVHDRLTRQTTRVSVASGGTEATGGDGYNPTISADGRFVAFQSNASNLVSGDSGWTDVFVHDRQTGETVRVSVGIGGTQATGESNKPTISADGRFVAFYSYAPNLVSGDTNGNYDVFVYDRQSGQTTRVSVKSDGTQASAGHSHHPSISADGRFVAFLSGASNLVSGDSGWTDVFVHDRQTGETARVSVGIGGTQGTGDSNSLTISANGRFVAFSSNASNLVPGDGNAAHDVFMHDRQTGRTTRVSVASDGTETYRSYYYTYTYVYCDYYGCYPYTYYYYAYYDSYQPVMSADGRFVAFYSYAPNLVVGDTNGQYDVFVVGGVTVSPSSASFTATGGSGAVDVSFIYPGTAWTARSAASWITVTNQSSTTGNGTVSYSVAPNTTGVARTGTLTVAAQTVTIQQAGPAAPVAQDGTLATNEDTAVGGTLVATDLNGDVLTYSLVSTGTLGTAAITNPATGAFAYTPNSNANGSDSFTFKANDGALDSNVAAVTVTITLINDVPLATDGTLTTNEDTAASGTLAATDVESPTLTYSLVSTGTRGTAVLTDAATGAFTYTPNPNAYGADAFTFRASDGTATSNVATIMVTVHAVIDPQEPLVVTVPAGTAVFGSSFSAWTTGGSGSGALTFAASGACSNVAGGAEITMISGTGDCTITATKAGDTDFTPITSSPVTVVATTAASATSIASSLNPATYGQAVTLTAMVTSTAGIPGGSVTFTDGGSTLGSVSLDATGQAMLTVSLAAGTHSLSASYGGSPNHAGSASTVLGEAVAIATTATSLTSSLNPSGPGQQVAFVATVLGHYGGPVTGIVTFRRGTVTVLGTVPVVNGTATLSISSLGGGSHVISATYSGDASSTGSTSPSLTQTVLQPTVSTTTSLTSSLNPSTVGQPVTFTAVVSPTTPGTPTGTVTFRLGQTPLATVPLAGARATYTTGTLPAGTLGISAVYSGDLQFLGSTSASLSQTVSKATTTTTLGSAPNPSAPGQAVTFSITVTSSTGLIPTGVVTLKRGGTDLATATLDAAGQASLTITLSSGRYPIRAVYDGDAITLNSTSNTIQQQVQ